MLPKEAIQEYQQIYKAKCNISLNFDEAKVSAENFIQLFALISNQQTKPVAKQKSL